ncbi:acetyl-CoA carboxylase biotin carboxyl carrier protein subunit [Endozoicomonas euniceicola]|uniref:Lipoyl-binding domain-containing protein n=1 Tax=Endozoicomonas euniceicola TaxID=1234143 RepID=A0ABY6GYA4_9GAMM|nr:biotin/lipoyl-containing protein [Endozoicomonas euniceicola]UYM17757.1 hypothetical protein NX720_07570 [Endozoicomonas euniceicola]
MQPKFLFNGTVHPVIPVRRQQSVQLEIDGRIITAELQWQSAHSAELTIDGKNRQVHVAQDDQQLFVHLDGKTWWLECLDEFSEAASEGGSASGIVIAPMPGVVVELNTSVGESVTEGDHLLLIESMKLQMAIRATATGTVENIHISGTGDSFEKGSVLVEITPEGSA